MTSNVKLLPLPDWSGAQLIPDNMIRDYARACVAHATEALREQREFQAALIEELLPYQDEAVASRAKIEALRMEIKGHRLAIQQLYDRAERLAEALQWYVDNDDTNDGQEGNEFWIAGRDRARALLREQEKQ